MPTRVLIIALFSSTISLLSAGAAAKPSLAPPPAYPCTTSNPPTVALRATIVNAGNSVQDDGLGDYIDNVSNANVETISAFALRTFRQYRPNSKPIRGFSVDLNNPVPGGGGVPRGIFFDEKAVFGSYWYVDSNSHVYGIQEIPIGITVESDRTQIWITNPGDGRRHVLHFGPWSNECEPFGPIVTIGSTKVQITRTGMNSYSFYAPPGSVATLSDINDNNQQTPIYQGLFYVNLLINASARR
jgi:hypothetical protein